MVATRIDWGVKAITGERRAHTLSGPITASYSGTRPGTQG
jgi:hypothetical protein